MSKKEFLFRINKNKRLVLCHFTHKENIYSNLSHIMFNIWQYKRNKTPKKIDGIPFSGYTTDTMYKDVILLADSIMDEILQVKDVLPKKQQKLCNYLVMNCEQVGVMTVAELAQAAGVGTTTVMRLVQTLGRKSFTEFKKEFLNSTLMRTATSYHRMKQSFQHTAHLAQGGTLQDVITDGLSVLENLCTPANTGQFEKMMDILEKAHRIFLFGLRSSRPMASYCEYALSTFYPQVYQLSDDPEYVFDRAALYPQPEDAILVYSVWPSTRKTVEVVELCHKKGVPVVLITNTALNPAVKFSDATIDANSANRLSGRTVIMAVTEAVVAELGRRKAPTSSENIETVEALLDEKHIVLKDY